MRLALIGAGHAHLHLLHHAADLAAAGLEVSLVAPATFRYSGVATAASSGELPPDAGVVDVAALASEQGVAHVDDRAVGLDRHGRVVRTESGRHVPWDLLSLSVGSVPATTGIRVGPDVVRIKPLDAYLDLRRRLDELAATSGVRAVVVGSGASGLEAAGHVAARLGPGSEVVVVERDLVPAAFLAPAPRHAVLRFLSARGVTVRVGTRVVEVAGDRVMTADGHVLRCDLAVLATGLRANPLVEQFGLGDHRGVPVGATLQHVRDDDVFAAGDCAHFTPRPLPSLGVHGVRQGPILLGALRARALREPPPAYDPPDHALQVLDLGAGVGLAVRGRWWTCGTGALRLKRIIDARWLRRVRPGAASGVRPWARSVVEPRDDALGDLVRR